MKCDTQWSCEWKHPFKQEWKERGYLVPKSMFLKWNKIALSLVSLVYLSAKLELHSCLSISLESEF